MYKCPLTLLQLLARSANLLFCHAAPHFESASFVGALGDLKFRHDNRFEQALTARPDSRCIGETLKRIKNIGLGASFPPSTHKVSQCYPALVTSGPSSTRQEPQRRPEPESLRAPKPRTREAKPQPLKPLGRGRASSNLAGLLEDRLRF